MHGAAPCLLTQPFAVDFTEINHTGTYQTDAAMALTPIDPKINVALYSHTDIGSADDRVTSKSVRRAGRQRHLGRP